MQHGRLHRKHALPMITHLLTRADAEDLLYLEARLIDNKRFEDWLALFTDDARYWVPSNHDAVDPAREISIIYDDRARLEDRVFRLHLPSMLAQHPVSRTTHVVTNVEVVPQSDDAGDTVTVYSCFTIHEVREGDWRQQGLGLHSQRLIAGRYEHHLRPVQDTWRISMKKALLLHSDIPITNLSFLV